MHTKHLATKAHTERGTKVEPEHEACLQEEEGFSSGRTSGRIDGEEADLEVSRSVHTRANGGDPGAAKSTAGTGHRDDLASMDRSNALLDPMLQLMQPL